MFGIRRAWLGVLLVAWFAPAAVFAANAGNSQATPCDADNGGIVLPKGFCATVFADKLGPARHLTVTRSGVVYVMLRRPYNGGSVVALRDSDHDGHADVDKRFDDKGNTGIGIYHGYLYVSSMTAIRRYKLPSDGLVPRGKPETIVEAIPAQSEHGARSFAISAGGVLYMNVGAPSDACQKQDRVPGSKGMDPCPLLKLYAGVFAFRADKTHQIYTSPGHRYATGIRNSVALAWNAAQKQLYVVQHGRDQLHQNWPQRFTLNQGATLPAEEFFKVDKGDNFGWPYCYYDPRKHEKVLAPEYGGDGNKIGRCGKFEKPILAFPAHWAPDGLMFYTGKQFPQRYRNGAFIAFHGSWNRAPFPQQGYKVVFVPFKGGMPVSDHWQDFADGFAGHKSLRSPGSANYRPMGLAQGPHGALYISDNPRGRIWRVTYTGGS